MKIVSIGDNLHEMSNPFSEKMKKNILYSHLLKFSPSMQSVKYQTSKETHEYAKKCMNMQSFTAKTCW